jgi:hypothetical protein
MPFDPATRIARKQTLGNFILRVFDLIYSKALPTTCSPLRSALGRLIDQAGNLTTNVRSHGPRPAFTVGKKAAVICLHFLSSMRRFHEKLCASGRGVTGHGSKLGKSRSAAN